MSTEAFGARRVTESLSAIGKYIDDAVQIADGVPPGQSIRLDLADVVSAPLPIVKNVTWEKSGSNTLSLDDIEVGSPLVLKVVGDNLTPGDVFRLVGASEGAASFLAVVSNVNATGKTLDASVTMPYPSPGSFDALVSDKHGQAFLLPGACRIVVGHQSRDKRLRNQRGTPAV
jgi:hypothetical protein